MPTLLVMDGGRTSYDRPRTTESPPAVEPPSREREPSAAAEPPSSPCPGPPPTPVAPVITGVEQGGPELLSRSLKLAYGIVFAALAFSTLGLVYVHLHAGGRIAARAESATTTTTSAPRTTITVPVPVPSALKANAESAATALISSWAAGNRAVALTVAMPVAVATLFGVRYGSGLAIDRGCSTSFVPIVCTFGPPGGANPNDAIYEIDVSQAAGGWYVSSVKIEN